MDDTLPKAIQAQLEQAEAIEKQLAAMAAAPADQGNTEDQPAQPAQAPAPEQQQVAEPTPQPAQPVDQGDDTWKHKFDVISGKYQAEVPRLYGQLKEQNQQLEQLQRELAELKAKAAAEPEKPKESLVTSKDEEAFGSDLIDMARRVTRDEIGQVLDRINQIEQMLKRIEALPQQVQQVAQQQAQSAEERYWGAVNTAIPDWNQIDSDPRWVEWLNTRAPFAVKTYRELAGEAIQAGQIEPIVELVKAWKQAAGIAQAQQQQSKSQQELERQVAPSKQNASQTPAGKKIYTREEYERAYDPRTLKDMSDADVDKLHAELDLAVAEGRVRF